MDLDCILFAVSDSGVYEDGTISEETSGDNDCCNGGDAQISVGHDSVFIDATNQATVDHIDLSDQVIHTNYVHVIIWLWASTIPVVLWSWPRLLANSSVSLRRTKNE
jgi:hypothetical protein